MSQQRILVIGAVPHPKDLKSYGGTTTLMQNFLDYADGKCKVIHIDTFRYKNRILNMAYFFIFFIWGLLRTNIIMYNVSMNGAFSLFYHTAPLAYALRKKVIFRKYGGSFLSQLASSPSKKRLKMTSLLNKADIIYFETKALLEEGKKMFQHPDRIRWFPNCRQPFSVQHERAFQHRFVFISHIREGKGIDQILEVAEKLPANYVIDIYGSIQEEKYSKTGFFDNKRAVYRGALRTEEVLPTLANYDVLLLPTFLPTEGYPGIIIEAMSLGIPAIATNWRGIPELIKDGENGLLIPPHDAEALHQAILSVSIENYVHFSTNALGAFNKYYNSDTVNKRILKEIFSI